MWKESVKKKVDAILHEYEAIRSVDENAELKIVINKEELRASGFSALSVDAKAWWDLIPPVIEISAGKDENNEWYIRFCFDFNDEGIPLGYHRNDYYEYGDDALDAIRRYVARYADRVRISTNC